MATWPASGTTDWNTKMLAYLAVEHTTAGYHKYPVDGTPTEVRTKYLTGNLDADAQTTVAHGLTAANILSVSVIVEDNGNSIWRFGGYQSGDGGATSRVDFYFDATNIVISSVGTNYQGDRYRIRIDYTV